MLVERKVAKKGGISLTTTQVQYWTYKEGQRHNIVNEREAKRHNVASENLEKQNIKIRNYSAKEAKRHNLATEGLTARDIDEKTRHNKASESLSASEINIKQQEVNVRQQQLSEITRHNLASEKLADYSNKTQRSFNDSSIKNEVRRLDIEEMFKSSESVTDFALMLDKVGLSIGAKIYAVEELLMNPNVSKASKEELMKYVNKLYHSNVGMQRKTVPDGKGGTKEIYTLHDNVKKKFKHH